MTVSSTVDTEAAVHAARQKLEDTENRIRNGDDTAAGELHAAQAALTIETLRHEGALQVQEQAQADKKAARALAYRRKIEQLIERKKHIGTLVQEFETSLIDLIAAYDGLERAEQNLIDSATREDPDELQTSRNYSGYTRGVGVGRAISVTIPGATINGAVSAGVTVDLIAKHHGIDLRRTRASVIKDRDALYKSLGMASS